MTRRLIALDLAGGTRFVDELRRAWECGDAVMPLDPRAPESATQALLERMRPHAVVSAAGTRTLADGIDTGDDDAIVIPTSGSTGAPKGVVLTHAAVGASAAATSARLGVTAEDHWLACLPLAHIGGLSVITRALWAGTALTVLAGFDAAAVMAAADAGANLVSLVGTALGRIDPTRFDTIVLGGARPPEDRPANTVATYGMTETGSGIVYDRVPLDGVEVRIVDGEVQVRGPMLLRCYRGGEPFEHSPLDDDGWFATGDMGTLDADGTLHVQGRRGDMIITGGENVWPEPVEALIGALDGVQAVSITGTPDREWGELVTAHVVLARGAAITLDALRDAVKRQLPAYCAPKRLVVHDSLPTTALGKPQRHLLRGV